MSWKKVSLEEITHNLDSLRIPLNETERKRKEINGKYPYVGANNILGYINEYIFDQKILCVAEDGGSWGKNQKCSFIVNEKCWVNNHAHVLIARNGSSLDFIKHYLNYADLTGYITGTTRGKLTKTALNSIQIPLPPDTVQHKIATILDQADEIRRRDRQLTVKYNEMLQSIFYQMFGDPVRNDKRWDIQNIRNAALKISDGPFGSNLKSEHYVSSGIRVIRLQNIGVNEFVDDDKSYISELHYEKLKKNSCFPGDIIVGTMGDPNLRACIQPKNIPVAVNKADCVLIRPDENVVTKEFLCYLLNNEQFVSSTSNLILGQTRGRISMGRLSTTFIPIPPPSIQKKFSTIVKCIELQKEIAKRQSQQSENLFQSLIQKAFKGELVN